jgi:acetolactate synthase-1/3 small subunit
LISDLVASTADEKEMTQDNVNIQHTLSVYVTNKPGVLSRISQTFARRGFNIESLVVSPGRDEQFSRMTIGVSGDPDMLDQIIQQLMKLIDVVHCKEHSSDDSVVKELGMIKMQCTPEERAEALQIAEHYGCKAVDLTRTSLILMISGSSQKIDALLEILSNFDVIETVRTGKVVMVRGGSKT